MGHSVWADVVPFVMHRFLETSQSGMEDFSLTEQLMTMPDEWAVGELEEDEAEYLKIEAEPRREAEINGWRLAIATDHPEYCDANIGKDGTLYGYVWKKDQFVVHVVNESAYSNVGEYEMSACSNDRASIEAFKSDFGLSSKIEEVDVVMQAG